jgi:hypothetical protein
METSEPATEQSAQPATTAVAGEAGPVVSPGPVGLPEAILEHPVQADPPTAVLPESPPDLAAPEPAAQEAPARRRAGRRPLDLHLPGPLVALLVGAVAGLALVGLTTAGRQACSAVRGTSSCGTPGILLLLAATVLTVLLGSLLLKRAGVDSAGSTSFLGVGLLVVVILLALLPVIYQWWMVIVVPAVAMATYAAAWWLTTTYVEPGERAR